MSTTPIVHVNNFEWHISNAYDVLHLESLFPQHLLYCSAMCVKLLEKMSCLQNLVCVLGVLFAF